MPVGINTELFKRNTEIPKIKNSILSLGRISPIKKIHEIIASLKLLNKNKINYTINIVGSPLPKDKKYFDQLKKNVPPSTKKNTHWIRACTNKEAVYHYNANELFINLTPSGSLDKTILEAMASETLILTSNEFFKEILDQKFMIKSDENVSNKISSILEISRDESTTIGRELRKYVIENHSLQKLAHDLFNIIK